MDIPTALRESADELGWSITRIASEAGVTELAARYWIAGKRRMSADTLVRLAHRMPGLRRRLFPSRRSAAK